ncbi:MAG: hypothetical protein ABI411_01905 [Tahibacter sp.]
MRDPYEARVNLPLLVLVIAAHALCFAWILAPRAVVAAFERLRPASPQAIPASPLPVPPADPGARRLATSSPPAEAAPSTSRPDDPRREFSAAQIAGHQQQAAQRRRQRDLTDLNASPGQSFRQLAADATKTVSAGNDAAYQALERIERACTVAPVAEDAATPSPVGDPGGMLVGDDRARWNAALDAQKAIDGTMKPLCDAFGAEAIRRASAAYVTGPSTLARLAAIERSLRDSQTNPAERPRLLDQLRDLHRSDSREEISAALALALARYGDSADLVSARELWSTLAQSDDRYAVDATVYMRDADTDAGSAANVELAAALGSVDAIKQRIDDADRHADVARAWSWVAYRTWLTMRGCRGDSDLTSRALAGDLLALAQRDHQLAASDRLQAGILYLQRIERYGVRATAVDTCGD